MKLDCLTNFGLGFFHGRARRNTPCKIGYVSGIVVSRFFYNDGRSAIQPHFLSPACLRMLFKVPWRCRHSACPGTVTRFRLVLELSMASTCCDQKPAVVVEQSDHVGDFHLIDHANGPQPRTKPRQVNRPAAFGGREKE